MKKPIPLKVLEIPYFDNPYLILLNSHLRNEKVLIRPLKHIGNKQFGDLIWPYYLFYRLLGYRIVHMHWIPFNHEWALKLFIKTLKLTNTKLIWTLHNYLPHEPQFKDDRAILKFLLKNSDKIIVHSDETKNLVSKLVNKSKISIIPHGHLNNYYPNHITQLKAREILGIDPNKTVILLFGHIRRYKGLEEFIATLEKLDDSFVGLIVGNCQDDETKKSLIAKQKSLNNKLILKLGYVSDNDVQIYLNASDIHLLPYKNITTSGAILLSYAFKIPVIFKSNKNVQFYLANNKSGFFYKSKKELLNLIKSLANNRQYSRAIGKEGHRFSKKFDWKIIAKQTIQLYHQTLENQK